MTSNEFLQDFVWSGSRTRRRFGLECYVPMLDRIAREHGARLFCATTGQAPVDQVGLAIEDSYRRWRRFRAAHRLVRLFVLSKHVRTGGVGGGLVRRWRRFRLGPDPPD